MSVEHQEPENPIAKLIGIIFLISVPVVLIVMLGIVGTAFLSGSGVKTEKKAEGEVAAVTAAAPAPAPAAGGDAPQGDSAPAAQAAAAPANAGSGVDPAVMALGKTSYALCAACHGADGKGLQAGPALMAPSLHGSEVLLGDPDGPLLVVLKGIQKENMNFMGVMAPLAAGLDDEKLAAVLTYVRNSWGNTAPAVTVEQAASARARFADVNAPAGIKRAELEAIVKAHK